MIKIFFRIVVYFFIVSNILFSINIRADDYPNTSIGVLDLNKVLSESKAAVKAAEEIEEIAKKIEIEIQDSDQEIIDEQNKLIEAQSIMAPEAFEIKRKEYENKVQNYNINRQEKLISIDRMVEKSRNIILDNLRPILEDLSEKKGITILLEKGTILLNAENMDITSDVIKILNKELPKIDISYKE
mgnify:CR=1 FL=1